MAETNPAPSPSPDDMHWGISYLREDLQDVKHDLRDFRKEVQQQFADMRREFDDKIAELRMELADLRKEMNQGLRHNLLTMIAIGGIYTGIIIAFIEYRLPG